MQQTSTKYMLKYVKVKHKNKTVKEINIITNIRPFNFHNLTGYFKVL